MLPRIPFYFPLGKAGLFESRGEFVDGLEMEAFNGLVVADAGGDAFPPGDVQVIGIVCACRFAKD